VVKYKSGAECFAEAQKHLDQTGHASGCKRIDWPIAFLDRMWGLIFPTSFR
jgi:hypothetical protein